MIQVKRKRKKKKKKKKKKKMMMMMPHMPHPQLLTLCLTVNRIT
jgi:hypothetical protein